MGKKEEGYITDGLVFQLDGINKGTTDTSKWVDLVGGITFTEPNSTSVHMTDHIHLTAQERLVGDYMPSFSYDTHTIECVIDNPGQNWIFVILLKPASVSFYRNSAKRWCNGGNGSRETISQKLADGKNIFSFNKDMFIQNGQSYATEANTWGNYNPTYPIINSFRQDSQSYSKEYDLYAIRIYNRILTNDEILHNQLLDNKRFNLGLTI